MSEIVQSGCCKLWEGDLSPSWWAGGTMHPPNEHSWWRYGWLSRVVACHPPRLCYSCSLLHIPLEQTFNSPYALVHVFSHQNVWSQSSLGMPSTSFSTPGYYYGACYVAFKVSSLSLYQHPNFRHFNKRLVIQYTCFHCEFKVAGMPHWTWSGDASTTTWWTQKSACMQGLP